MDNFYRGCDINLLTSKLAKQAGKKLESTSAMHLALDIVDSTFCTHDENSGISFEKFAWVVYRNKLNDGIRKLYVRKNTGSLDAIASSTGNKQEIASKSQDIVREIGDHAKELLDSNTINLVEYNIIIMKSHCHENKDIAKELELSEGRISQIWNELKIMFWVHEQDDNGLSI